LYINIAEFGKNRSPFFSLKFLFFEEVRALPLHNFSEVFSKSAQFEAKLISFWEFLKIFPQKLLAET